MPGPRTDKKRAWDALEEVLRVQQLVKEALLLAECQTKIRTYEDDVWAALNSLCTSGRLDARQITLMKKLVVAVIRVERNVLPEEEWERESHHGR